MNFSVIVATVCVCVCVCVCVFSRLIVVESEQHCLC